MSPIQQAADRFGISQQRVCQLLKLFKGATGFTYTNRVGKRSVAKQRKCTEAMSAARSAKAEAAKVNFERLRRLKSFASREVAA